MGLEQMICPFCKSINIIPIRNSQGAHWMACADCKAAGPQHATREAAEQAFVVASEPGLIARMLGKGKKS